jgi:S1-C subfamily serine protease
MTYLNNFLIKFLFIFLLFFLSNCGDPKPREMTKGHMDAIKEQCKNDPDKKLCGKEVRFKFKRDGHKYVSLEELDKSERNRVAFNCADQKEYGLVTYNECLRDKKDLALGNNLTNQDSEPPLRSDVDKIKQYVYRIIAFNDGDERGGSSGTGVAIAKNYIVTNCHVVLDYKLSEQKKQAAYYDTVLVENLHDENKRGAVKLFKKGYKKDLDICILKTKSDLKYVQKRVKYKRLKQRMRVMAMGNPKGIIGHTSDGKITALETYETDIVHPLVNKNPIELQYPWKVIHHDAAIGQGSSGGPLFNTGGDLIGINTLALTEGTTGSFAIALSADHINDVLRD